MDRRLELHDILINILGSTNVYYQPPSTKKIEYPCIIYGRNSIDTKHSNNLPYILMMSYNVTIIDKNPDSPIIEKLSKLQLCKFNRHYTSDNLNHDVFTIFY